MKTNLYILFLLISLAALASATVWMYRPDLIPASIAHSGHSHYLILSMYSLGFILIFISIYIINRAITALRSRNRALSGEIANLNSQNAFFLQQIPLMKSNIESLSTMREISRAINIHVEFEKILEEVLRIIGQMTGASSLDIHLADTADPESIMALKAHYGARGDHGYFFLYFDGDPEQYPADEIEMGDFRQYTSDNHSLVDTALFHNGLYIGTGKVFTRTTGADLNNLKLFLGEKTAAFEINRDNIARAVEVKNIIRVQEGRNLQFTAPLIAEQKVLGVIKMTIESIISAFNPDLVEEMLRESCKHISLAIKKADLYEKAVKDGMTNLYNKQHFLNQLNIHIALAQSSGKKFTLLMFDIDHFKNVNDTYGHLTGDIILIGVANILRRNLREQDMAFRYGGEEMSIVLDDTAIRKASKVANRIRKTIKEKVFTGEHGDSISVTVSIGVCQFYSDIMSSPEDVISRADQALYRAKESGRDKVIAARKPSGRK